ncbi:unnamed protein product [Polarella glacialis]|uniref:Uncharacterized protein n=1 Tax=Polarella glacialis TaxID=89957 RepID=A0A813HUJ1_POLGL|nr:unnamed protein product [Polarella glacialis]
MSNSSANSSALLGGMVPLVIRGGFGSRSVWASTLRQTPGSSEDARQNACRETTSLAFTAHSSAAKDGLLNLTCFGTWASLLTTLGRLDLPIVILARLLSTEASLTSDGEVARYVAFNTLPFSMIIGSMKLYSTVLGGDFDRRQWSAMNSMCQVLPAAVREFIRLYLISGMDFVDFWYALVWVLPLWNSFDRRVDSILQPELSGEVAWGTCLLEASWMSGFFLSLP